MSRVLAIKRTIQIYMPHVVRRKYLNLRCMLDCSETFIERPRDLKLQSATWSDYKYHNSRPEEDVLFLFRKFTVSFFCTADQ